jgi:hypothetical protein
MIFSGSRYDPATAYTITRPDGKLVAVLRPALPRPAALRGYSRRQSVAHRLDLIANFFLGDATAFWKLCDANASIVPDALSARDLIGIPPAGQ